MEPPRGCPRRPHRGDQPAVRLARGPRPGTGALLLERAARDARERSLHPVLDVLASDTAAAALYESLGWSRLATVEQRWSPEQTVRVHCYAAPA